MRLLLMFINGIIDNALILRLALLVIPSKRSLKLSLLSTLIPSSSSQLVFLFRKDQYALIYSHFC